MTLLSAPSRALSGMPSPEPRGPVSGALLELIPSDPGGRDSAHDPVADLHALTVAALDSTPDVLADEDLQLALFCLDELHYGGIAGVSDDWEWDPELIRVRSLIDAAHEAALREAVRVPPRPAATADAVADALFALTAPEGRPGLAHFLAREATRAQAREFLVLRSIYTLKEADPHSWAIPRLRGRPKVALVEVQSDEYGAGRPERQHAALFAASMRGAGLDDGYGAYLDLVPAPVLASVNTMSLFGLRRRLRGAVAGHLAAFEMTSSLPNRLYATGFRRLGFGDDVAEYFEEHVEADAVHEQIAGRDLAGALAEDEPDLLDDILFGAAACLYIDERAGAVMPAAWKAGRSALRGPLPE